MKSRISILGALTLRQHLNGFAIATILAGVGLLAAAWPAEAEIVYTHVNITITGNASYNLDLNPDGVTDFTITSVVGCDEPNNCMDGCGVYGYVSEAPSSGNAALIGPLSEGDEIGPDQVFTAAATTLEGFSIGSNRKGSPCTVHYFGPWHVRLKGKRYLGLSFQLNGETYYGWVQLNLGEGSAKLHGYAYESTPGMPINAGQTK